MGKKALKDRQIGRRLKESLATSGHSASWLAKETGIELPTVYSILSGNQLPSIEKLRRLCKALNLSVDWLLEIESDAYYSFPEPGKESQSYAEFEDAILSNSSGERISVSRGFSIVHQPVELRRQILQKIYGMQDDQLEVALEGFLMRRRVIDKHEKRRIEFVVGSEIEDFISQRPPWDKVDGELISEFVHSVLERLENDPINYEVTIIPRQSFLVNYEVLNREVVVFDLGTVFLKQSHERIAEHFLLEVEGFMRHPETISGRQEVSDYLTRILSKSAKREVAL